MPAVLIINADDFGYSPGVNTAIVECHAAGGLDSATLMAGGNAFQDAVSRAAALRGLDIGVHVTLTELPALSRPAEAPGLVDPDGLLPSSPGALLRGVVSGKISRDALRSEIDLQVQRVLDHGIVPSHLDTHKHVHVIPQVAEVVAEVARRRYIRWVRNPFESEGVLGLFNSVESGNRAAFVKQFMKARIVQTWKPAFMKIMKREELKAPDRFLGVSLTGLWNRTLYAKTLGRLKPGVTEIMFHPGYVDDHLDRCGTRLRESREIERSLLMDPEFSNIQTRLGIRRGRFAG